MAVLEVVNSKAEKVSQVELADEIFGVLPKSDVLHEVVTMQLAAKRAGSASAKKRSQVAGSTRKLFRQKGTGRARRGDIRSPLLRGGGVVFGPIPKSYAYRVPRKVRKLALKMALSSKLIENELIIVDKFELESLKTKAFKQVIGNLGIKGKALVVSPEKDETLETCSRNIPQVKILRVDGLNVYDILKFEKLILLEPSIEKIERRLL